MASVFKDLLQSSAIEMGCLIQELLDVDQVDSAVGENELEGLNLNAYLKKINEELKEYSEHQKVDFKLDTPNEDVFIMGFGRPLAHALSNILFNAITYSPANGIVKLEVIADAGKVILSVTDHGSGVPIAEQNQFFPNLVEFQLKQKVVVGLGSISSSM